MTPRARMIALATCLFFSGAAGLVYEVVWSRYLELILGSTGRAHVLVLAIYMTGLAIGSQIFGGIADRTSRPIKLYAILEGLIGVCATIFPLLYDPLLAFVDKFYVPGGSITHSLAAFGACSLALLPPTILMGGTLPVVSRALARSDASIGHVVSLLYFLNSLGAVAGTLLGGFWFVQDYGMPGAIYTASLLNLVAMLLALWTSGRPAAEAESVAHVEMTAPEPGAHQRARVALIVIAVSGFVSFVYEIVWIRLLTLVLGSAAYAFPLMLGAFISGIALGSFALSRRKRDTGHYEVLGWCELLIGISALFTLVGYEWLIIAPNRLHAMFGNSEYGYPLFLSCEFLLCFAVMIVPTLFMGATLPAASRVAAERLEILGRRVGSAFALNTMGTVAGAFVGGFVLLPHLGMKNTIEAAAAMNVVLGLWVLATSRESRWHATRAAMATAVGVAVFAVIMPKWDERFLTAAAYRSLRRIESLEHFRRGGDQRKLLYYADGTDATIAVASTPDAQVGEVLILLINGKTDASTKVDMWTQLLVGHIPMMMHPDPKQVLVVGLGAGMTAGAALNGGAEHVDVVELIPEVVEAARFFSPWNEGLHTHPNASIIIDDARTYMRASDKKYDLIINEPSNLWVAGVPGVFTLEHFQHARQRLKPGGLYAQWIHSYEINDATFFGVIHTFQQVFPYWTCFNVSGEDVLFVGAPQPFGPDFARMEAYMAQKRVAEQLSGSGIEGVMPLLSAQILVKTDTPGPAVPPVATYRDLEPRIEYETARAFFAGSKARNVRWLDTRGFSPARSKLWIYQYKPTVTPPSDSFAKYVLAVSTESPIFEALPHAWCDVWEKYHPEDPRVAVARAQVALQEGAEPRAPDVSALPDTLDALLVKMIALKRQYIAARSFANQPDTAPLRSVIAKLMSDAPSERPQALALLGDLELDEGRPESAIKNYAASLRALGEGLQTLSPPPTRDELAYKIAEAYIDSGDVASAGKFIESVKDKLTDPVLTVKFRFLECRYQQLAMKSSPPK